MGGGNTVSNIFASNSNSNRLANILCLYRREHCRNSYHKESQAVYGKFVYCTQYESCTAGNTTTGKIYIPKDTKWYTLGSSKVSKFNSITQMGTYIVYIYICFCHCNCVRCGVVGSLVMMQNQQTCSRLNDDSSNEEENDSIELNLVLCALLALVPLTGVCVCVCVFQ